VIATESDFLIDFFYNGQHCRNRLRLYHPEMRNF